jgi:DNA-binding XRE family transcriptional regulator
MTQVRMAQALGIHWQTYQKFEYRSPLAPHLIPAFAAVRG